MLVGLGLLDKFQIIYNQQRFLYLVDKKLDKLQIIYKPVKIYLLS